MKIIITEQQNDKVVKKLTDTIKSDGWNKTVRLVGGSENLIKLLGITSPMEFLHLYDDMDVVQSKENPAWTLFRYKEGHNLMALSKKGFIYISNPDFWSILRDVFRLNYDDIEKLIKVWLDEVNILKDDTPNLYFFELNPSSGISSII